MSLYERESTLLNAVSLSFAIIRELLYHKVVRVLFWGLNAFSIKVLQIEWGLYSLMILILTRRSLFATDSSD